MIADLRQLWQEAFGDSQETLDAFFATGFSSERCHFLVENEIPVSALYWFDCALGGKKLAYIYAVATKKSHRGKGFAARLMEETHSLLREKGYAGAILVPGEESLFAYYEKLGYRAATKVEGFTATVAESPVSVREISPAEYACLRKNYLPNGGVLQEGETLSYLATYARFYKGEDFLLSASHQGESLLVHEFLGNTDICGNILCALGFSRGVFRTPGNGRDFAMLFSLIEDCPVPTYFGLALD